MKMLRASLSIMFVIVFIFTLFCASAFASSTYYCSDCHAYREFRRVYSHSTQVRTTCTTHSNCVVVTTTKYYNLYCKVCGYGGGAHGEQEVTVKHQPLAK